MKERGRRKVLIKTEEKKGEERRGGGVRGFLVEFCHLVVSFCSASGCCRSPCDSLKRFVSLM